MRRAPEKPVDRRLLREASWLPVKRDSGSSFSFRHLRTRIFPFPFHYHPEMELTYVVRGSGQRIVGEVVRPFSEGDLVLLGSMLPHVWISDPHCALTDAYVLRFDSGLVENLLQSQVECAAALAWIRRASAGLEWRRGAAPAPDGLWANLERAATPAKRLLGFLELVLTLAGSGCWRTICGGFRGPVVRGSGEQRVGFAVRYLREHFCGEVWQADVARKVGMETSAFSRLFRRTTGRTFQGMLVELRVNQACRLLGSTTMPVTEICFASGFRNLSNFNKQFLAAKGSSPRDYRRRLLS